MSGTLMFVADTDALEDRGPFSGPGPSNSTFSGTVKPADVRFAMPVTKPGPSGHGGIDYIEQDIGGTTGPRNDATVRNAPGIRPLRVRTAPFNGAIFNMRTIVQTRATGVVGRNNRSNVGVRAKSADETNLPDNGAVLAAFTNPALSRLLTRMRRNG